MAIRMSGLQSGMDTEALVNALVSGYNVQKDSLVKAQTKLQWKQDSWKSMNTSIYSFYSGKLSAARLEKTYNLKSASISDSTKAKVSASSAAVNGTQTLEIKKLAATGYLTGGKISASNGSKITGDTKLSDITGQASGSIKLTTDGNTTEITIEEGMTVDKFVSKLKEAGVNANFDETNQRFFISAKTSGASTDFSLVASDNEGLTSIQKLGLFTKNATERAEYEKLANISESERQEMIDSIYSKKEVKAEDRAKAYADRYNKAKTTIDTMESDNTWWPGEGTTLESLKSGIDAQKAALKEKYKGYVKTDDDGNETIDTSSMSETELAEYNAENDKINTAQSKYEEYKSAKQELEATADYVKVNSDGTAEADATNGKVVAEVEADNNLAKDQATKEVEDKIAYAKKVLNTMDSLDESDGAVRIIGEDSKIILNGATYTNNTNNFSINGLTIEAMGITNGALSVTTNTDTDAIYNNIKDFFKEYNTLIKAMDEAYNADSSSGYEPLTDDEKEAMSDAEVEKWEKKIKDSLLRKDSILGNTSNSIKNLMAQSIEIDGKKYSLSSFGIKTQSYFEAATNEKGMYHIDGNKDDSVSAGNEDKLKEAIASDPEVVVQFFTKLTSAVYSDLGKRMASSTSSSAYTLYNDKDMTKEYNNYKTKISDQEDKISTWEDYYYKKFTSMETALAKLNNTQSSLSGYFSS